MTEEEIKALQDAKDAAEKRVADAEKAAVDAKLLADKSEQDKLNLVEELKIERQKKQEALDKAKINNGELDVDSLIEQKLAEREKTFRDASMKEAIEEFKNSKSVFKNDTAGLVFGKFEAELKKFNLSDVSTKEQVKARLEEVFKFSGFTSEGDGASEYEGSIASPHIAPEGNAQVKSDVKSALDLTGISEDRYKKLKEKYPDAMSNVGL